MKFKNKPLGSLTSLSKKEKIYKLCEFLFCFLIAATVFEFTYMLFYNQAKIPYVHNRIGRPYFSDLAIHIHWAIRSKRAYSAVGFLLKYSYNLVKTTKGCAFMLATVVTLTLFACNYFFTACLDVNKNKLNRSFSFFLSAPLCFIGGLYLGKLYPVFYANLNIEKSVGIDISQPWHNSTYTVMKLFAFVTLALFVKIDSKYIEEGIGLDEWLFFCASLTLTNFSKPNFFIAFAPAMLCMLIYDFIRTKFKGIKNIIFFGCAVLMSMPIFRFQSGMLYKSGPIVNSGSSASKTQSGIVFSFDRLINAFSNKNFYISMLCSFAFAIIVLIICIIKKGVNRTLVFGLIMNLFGELARWCLSESGPRANDGNMTWGVHFTSLALTVFSLERLIYLYKEKKIKTVTFILVMAILVLMVASGIAYFVKCSQGKPYLI